MGTVEQIAEEAGVSTDTVMRVLRGQNKEVWPSSARRAAQIREIAQRLGYMPNSSARAMRSGRSNAIALLLNANEGYSYLPNELFGGISNALHKRSMRLIVSQMVDEELTNPQLMPVILREWSCDGLLINYTDHVPQALDDLISQYHIPAVWINRKYPNDAVYYDDFAGGQEATRYLLGLGHKKIMYLDFQPKETWAEAHYSCADRYDGYAKVMQDAGLTPTPAGLYGDVPTERRVPVLTELLRGKDRPTAILAYQWGVPVLYAAALAGLEIPRDMSVMAFKVKPKKIWAHMVDYTFDRVLTTMNVPAEDAGQMALEMLLSKIETPSQILTSKILPLELHLGDTCGPVSHS